MSLLALALAGCGTVERPPADPKLLSFLDHQIPTRTETVNRLGKPTNTSENGRIAFYRIGETRHGLFVREPRWEKQTRKHHSLVLVYSTNNVVTNHALNRVR